jgi:hypothetical protein
VASVMAREPAILRELPVLDPRQTPTARESSTGAMWETEWSHPGSLLSPGTGAAGAPLDLQAD